MQIYKQLLSQKNLPAKKTRTAPSPWKTYRNFRKILYTTDSLNFLGGSFQIDTSVWLWKPTWRHLRKPLKPFLIIFHLHLDLSKSNMCPCYYQMHCNNLNIWINYKYTYFFYFEHETVEYFAPDQQQPGLPASGLSGQFWDEFWNHVTKQDLLSIFKLMLFVT